MAKQDSYGRRPARPMTCAEYMAAFMELDRVTLDHGISVAGVEKAIAKFVQLDWD